MHGVAQLSRYVMFKKNFDSYVNKVTGFCSLFHDIKIIEFARKAKCKIYYLLKSAINLDIKAG